MLDATAAKQYLRSFDFKSLFIKELGWDRHDGKVDIVVDGQNFRLAGVAHKRGMTAFVFQADGSLPDYALRGKIERQVTRLAHEHIVIFVDKQKTLQIWQWVKREPGKPTACREHHYQKGQSGEALIQKLNNIAFSLDEEEQLSLIDVTIRARAGFDVEKVTKKFYDRFKTEHAAFLKFLKGIPDEELQRWYASVMINRLMFIYFIQKKGFLNSDRDYLRNKLKESKQRGKDKYYKEFLCPLFFDGFASKEDERSASVNKLLGFVPYLNGGLFLKHQIEEAHGKTIQVSDAAFQKIFDFFDQYQWHLDERPTRQDNEINPDILGYIFEKYINQKQMGAYYTKEDITEYISKNTILPFLFDEAKKKCKIAFEGERSVWKLLQNDPDRYIYDAVKYGVTKPLPKDIGAGQKVVSKRTGWNKPAPESYALPAEIWREVVARRTKYEEVKTKLAKGEIESINDLITYNLNIRQFAQDVIENCEGPELLRAFWHTIVGRLPEKSNEKFEQGITILDPTCGSGAFLFAALNILEPLYEACLDRMEVFVDELDRQEAKPHPEKYSDFRKVLKRIDEHPSRRYFVLKSIIINNLFGVDIMEEATEICKLRLFLKLVAQIDDSKNIEPLPDIDFNIRAGNTLVGYATYNHLVQAVTDAEHGQIKLMSSEEEKTLRRITEAAEDVDAQFKRFRQQQTEIGGTVTVEDKRVLTQSMKKLDDELNGYLAKQYSIGTKKAPAYDTWHKSHRPFHWFVEFYGIMNDGGFDVVIGNPPYLDLKDLADYKVIGYGLGGTRNLYSLLIERCQALVDGKGQQGFIVPVSSVASEGYLELQRLLLTRRLVYSAFDDRPAHLFEGLDKNTLSIILLGEESKQPAAHSTRLCRWSGAERNHLFSVLRFDVSPQSTLPGCLPKIGSAIEANIWKKLFESHHSKLAYSYASTSKHVTYYSRKVNAFLQILDFMPVVRDGKGKQRRPSEFKELHFPVREQALTVFSVFNSSLFRWFIDAVSDGSHLNRREVDNFPLDPSEIYSKYPTVIQFAEELSDSLRNNSIVRKMTYQHDTLTVQCIIPKFSKLVIDEIDRVLAKYYGFTEEELDFIINYDIKYRMGKEGVEEEDEK